MFRLKLLALAVGICVMLLLLFFITLLWSELILVPWDTAIVRPEIGTLARTVNDFFERAPGSYIAPVTVTVIGVLLTLRAYRQRPSTGTLARALVYHALCFAGIIGFGVISFQVNNAVYPYTAVGYDPTYHGYYRSIIPGLTALGVLAAWIWALTRTARSQPGRP